MDFDMASNDELTMSVHCCVLFLFLRRYDEGAKGKLMVTITITATAGAGAAAAAPQQQQEQQQEQQEQQQEQRAAEPIKALKLTNGRVQRPDRDKRLHAYEVRGMRYEVRGMRYEV